VVLVVCMSYVDGIDGVFIGLLTISYHVTLVIIGHYDRGSDDIQEYFVLDGFLDCFCSYFDYFYLRTA